MKPSLKSIRLLLLLAAVTMGSIDVFAQDVAPTPLREWDFNNVAFAFGRYADEGSTINSDAAKEDWQRKDIDVQIEEAYWNANETLFTLMMNYVAIQLTSFCVALWENPFGSNSVGIINQRTQAGWFPPLFGQAHMLNVIIVLALTVGMFVYLKKAKQGFEISVVGYSESTARYVGINVEKVTVRTVAISGAICGLAGFIAVAGASHTISISTAGGQGFTAIIVAWLAQFNTFIMVSISLLLVTLQKGATQIASQYNLNDFAASVITGIILFFILGSEFFVRYRIIFKGSKGGKKA